MLQDFRNISKGDGCISKTYSTREFERLLNDNGYKFIRQKGDHIIYRKENNTIVITKDLNKMVAKRLIKENNLKEN